MIFDDEGTLLEGGGPVSDETTALAALLHASICEYHWPDLLTCGIDHESDAARLIAAGVRVAPSPTDLQRDRVIHAAFDVDGAWDAEDVDGAPILWLAEAGEVLADLRAAIEAMDDDKPWYSVLRDADSPIRTITTPDGQVYHADQCALAPDHAGPCMWVGGRRPEDPVYPVAPSPETPELREANSQSLRVAAQRVLDDWNRIGAQADGYRALAAALAAEPKP